MNVRINAIGLWWGCCARRAIVCAAAVIAAALPRAKALAQTDDPSAAATTHSRVVHVFDFTEPQNPNPKPMHWIRFPDPTLPIYPDAEFPRYTEALRDDNVGHDAAPSFYLESRGRNIAYRYTGPATRVSPGEYVVSGWIKPDRLMHARAALSAYYIDWDNRPIAGTQRFSPLIGSDAMSDDGWYQVMIRLPGATAGAQAIGLTCWVTQEDTWRDQPVPDHYIFYRDVRGGAWFDDIAIHGIPRVELAPSAAGGVYELPGSFDLIATVADENVDGIEATLKVFDLQRHLVHSADVPVHAFDDSDPAERIPIPELSPGYYIAQMSVSAQGTPIHQRSLAFAALAPHRPTGGRARRMGVLLDPAAPDDVEAETNLLSSLNTGLLKVDLWSGRSGHPGYAQRGDALIDLLDGLGGANISVIGVMGSPPPSLVSPVEPAATTLLDVLSENVDVWRSELDAVVAPYAGIFRTWQLGRDGDDVAASDPRGAKALADLRTAMRTMTTSPDLTCAAMAADAPSRKLPADNVSIRLPMDCQPQFVGDHIKPHLGLGYERVWVSIPLPTIDDYPRTAALGDWALRVVEACYSGVDGIVIPRPWTISDAKRFQPTQPLPDFVVFRTLVDVIGDLPPAQRIEIEKGTHAVTFASSGESAMIIWDEQAPPEGRSLTMQLGSAYRAVNLWGQPVPINVGPDGRHVLTVSRSPVLINGTEPWLIAFRAAISFEPDQMEFSYGTRRHVLALTNPHALPISGQVQLTPGEGWEVAPDTLQFGLEPGETVRFPVDLRHPANESAGTKVIRADIKLSSEPHYLIEVPLSLKLGLSDVDVWAYAIVRGDDVIVYQGITNQSSQRLSFRGFAALPGRERQYRSINVILPGQTFTTQYQFPNAASASGRDVRLGLREVGGPRIHNINVTIP